MSCVTISRVYLKRKFLGNLLLQQEVLSGNYIKEKLAMANHITVAELKKNYDQYLKRMEEGETFVITDIGENKLDLYRPLEDNRGIAIDIEQVKF